MALVLLVLFVALVSGDHTFEEWTRKHGKKYGSWRDHASRQDIWTKNMNEILAHNIRYMKGEETFDMGMNQHGDLTFDEFHTHKTCLKTSKNFNGTELGKTPMIRYKGSEFLPPVDEYTPPEEVDFRDLGYVTPVKNQGDCGSCWAFSVTGALEGQIFRKTGKLPSLSEQQLVDCSGEFGNDGCDGGIQDWGFMYTMSNKGLMSEQAYPYKGVQKKCKYAPKQAVGGATGYLDVTPGDEDMLKVALALNGPISIAIDASKQSFQFYNSGVYNEPKCGNSEDDLDHAVLLVGYGVSENGVPYYLVKNSWSTDWGMDGISRCQGMEITSAV